MPTYTATFRTAAEYATHDIKAKTPVQALRRARALFERTPDTLSFEHYDMRQPIDEIAIADAAGNELTVWQSANFRERENAWALLDAALLARRELRQFYAKDGDNEALRVLSIAITNALGTAEDAA